MMYLFREIKYTLLLSENEHDGVAHPIRLEVSMGSDGSVYVEEIIESTRPVILNNSHHTNWKAFKECFREAAEIIENEQKVHPI